MKLKHKTIPLSLTALLAVSACEAGDFCDVAESLRMEREAAAALVQIDRPAAEKIDAHNRYGERVCKWR